MTALSEVGAMARRVNCACLLCASYILHHAEMAVIQDAVLDSLVSPICTGTEMPDGLNWHSEQVPLYEVSRWP